MTVLNILGFLFFVAGVYWVKAIGPDKNGEGHVARGLGGLLMIFAAFLVWSLPRLKELGLFG